VGGSTIPALLDSAATSIASLGQSVQAWVQQINPEVFKPLLAFGGALVLVHQQPDAVAGTTPPPSPVPPGPVDPGSSGGHAIDGYLSNALVWRDTNGNQTWDAGEPYTFTDANGAFSGLTNGTGTIRVTGLTNALRAVLTNEPSGPSTDISTGKVFDGVLSAPEGATVINPLTTLVVAVGNGPNAAATLASLKAALGIDANVDLANFDPLAAMASGGNAAAALAIQAASIQVASLMTMAVSTLQSGGSTLSVGAIVSSVATSLVSQASTARSGNLLTDAAVLTATLQSAAASSGISGSALTALNNTLAAASTALVAVNTAIQTAVANAGSNVNLASALGTLTTVVAAQLVADDLTALVKAAAAPGSTTTFNAASASNFSATVATQVEAAKASVQQLVVTPPNQSLLVAVDDTLVVQKTPYQWPSKSGNLASNDVVSGGTVEVTSLSQGGHTSSTSNGVLVLQGTYGELRVASNGSYTYTVNRAVPVNADGSSQTEVFNYAAKNGSLTDSGQLVITLHNALTHLSLTSDILTVSDATHLTGVQGVVTGSKITFDLAAKGAGLDSVNLKNLLDGNSATQGTTPELQFDLQNLDALKLPQGPQTIGVTLDVQSSLIAGQHITAAFDAPIELVRDAHGVHLVVPQGPVNLHLSAAGIQIGDITVNNLDSDSFTLVEGINATPSLSIKLDHLLLKATDNTLSLGALNVTDLLPLAGGVLAGAFANKTVGDIVTLARVLVTNIPSVSDAHVATLIERLKAMVDLPEAFAGITLNQSLHLAAELFNLPDMPNDFVSLVNRVVGALGDSTLPQILHIIETTYPTATLGGVLDALHKNISLPDSVSAMPVADLAHNLTNLQAVASAFTTLLGADGATVSSLITHVKTLIDTQGVNLEALNHLFDLSPLFGAGYSATDLVHDLSQGQISAAPLITLVSKAMLSSDSTVSVDLHLPTSLGLTSANGTALQDIEVLLKVGSDVHTATAALRDVNGNHQLDLSDLQHLGSSDLSGLYISQANVGQFSVNGTALTGLVGHVTQAQLSSLAFTAPAGQTPQSLNHVEVTLWAEDAQGALSGAQHVNLYLV
jgi:VCBS repeat-containing protein